MNKKVSNLKRAHLAGELTRSILHFASALCSTHYHNRTTTQSPDLDLATRQNSQAILEKDQELSSLQHKLQLAEAELEKSEAKVKELKAASEEGETHRTTGENLARKVQLLEEELDKAEKDLKDTTEKWVVVVFCFFPTPSFPDFRMISVPIPISTCRGEMVS